MVDSPMFDVFLAHNSADKPKVKAIAEALKKRGLKPWLDEEQIRPGLSFQQEIQQAIPLVRSAAIFIGSEGLGRWQVMELRTLISQCVSKNIAVIPVLLPNVSEIPDDLLFLQEFSMVSFASGTDNLESLGRLVWGITGHKPDNINKEASIAQYRQKVEEFVAGGEISVVESFILQDVQEKLGLDPEEARVIRDQVLEPYGKYQEKLDQFRQIFTKLVAEQGYPLGARAKADLKKLQDYLELNDEDLVSLEKEAEHQKQQENERLQRQREESERLSKRQEVHDRQEVTSPVSESVVAQQLNAFEFEVVTIEVQRSGLLGLGSKVTSNRRRTQARYFTENLGNGVILDMVYIPGGKFTMGSPPDEKDSYDYERPQHKVTVQSFFMGKFQVTQAQWRAIASLPKVNRDLESDPSRFKGDDRPVEQVSWEDAVEFCQRLSKQTGKEYRLPSEAEWEYACRAGTTTPFHFGETITTDLANYDGNYTYANGPKGEYRQETTPVGSFPANAFGLYDMHGNVWEWCEDDWHGNYDNAPNDGRAWLSEEGSKKVICGGSWGLNPPYCRSADRYHSPRDYRDYSIGFCVVCVAARTT